MAVIDHQTLLLGTSRDAAEELNKMADYKKKEAIEALKSALINALDRIHILEKKCYQLGKKSCG